MKKTIIPVVTTDQGIRNMRNADIEANKIAKMIMSNGDSVISELINNDMDIDKVIELHKNKQVA